jgi:hypothetical protein
LQHAAPLRPLPPPSSQRDFCGSTPLSVVAGL